jgi:hypothetical protein
LKLALSPNDGETFLKEVDDELRRERVNSFVARFGWWIIGGVVLVLGSIAGYLWWSGNRAAAREAAGESLIEAVGQLESGSAPDRAAAAPKIAALAQSDIEGYRAAALFARANNETAAGNAPAAIATLRAIAADSGLDQSYRDAALIRQTALEFDTLQPQVVVQRMRPLAQPGSAWLGTAGELLGIAYLKMHKPELAGPVFASIGRDQRVPASIRERSIQMAGALGINAIDDPAAPATGRPVAPARPATTAAPAAPAATREKAE